MVFCIRAAVTTPILDCRMCRAGAAAVSFAMFDPQFLLAQQGLDSRQITPHFAHALEAFRLAGGHLKAQAEELVGQLALLQVELPDIQLLQFFHPPRHHCTPVRVTNWVLMGSLCAATVIASRAVATSSPSSSNRMRPGSTTATQYSGAPLP